MTSELKLKKKLKLSVRFFYRQKVKDSTALRVYFLLAYMGELFSAYNIIKHFLSILTENKPADLAMLARRVYFGAQKPLKPQNLWPQSFRVGVTYINRKLISRRNY